jgi:hypothetical protein
MEKTITVQVAELMHMSVGQLRERYAELFGEETNSRHRQWLLRRISYRVHELAEGGLSERARKRAAELADEGYLRRRLPTPPAEQQQSPPVTRGAEEPPKEQRDERLPAPGTVLVREFQGTAHEVTVLERGFLYQGKTYRSLSSIARAIAGTAWNGYRFFSQALKQAQEMT